ncbi:hypothetical protein D9756_000331 [Leucocoprinus leucothites]|uniref:Protein YOP1 n=1 Tax=Leucocoprinus leucothites TaxID=201217 RepID=A0A8H5GFV3_9AGAR|nr:hypothetical protein D9756_000331 [Leucoagaricus leucothites]
MAVFVRIFRLAMLFFNVYDSYKVLKLPPSSASNRGKPSLRAMSQRKRDMKGCLAVWIVWSCFIIYERFTEALISLFIPFYDEFKSLILLFLIMTRARGAEPIYLHIIRPFLKPYTSTIDQLLDFVHVVGDVVIGLASLPFIYAIQWWNRKFGTVQESLDTETESSSSPVSPAIELKTRLSVSRASTSKPARATAGLVPKPRQPVLKKPSTTLGGQKKGQVKGSQAQSTDRKPSTTTPHDLPTNDTTQIDGLPQRDEWREYPAFPSAYPPTPLVKQTQITAATVVSASTSLYPPISEEPAQQGFRQSLLPPHDDSNPSHAGGKSDETNIDGVQPEESEQITIAVMNVDGDDSIDEHMNDDADEFESEDEFNITLRTPDTSLRILTSLDPRPLSSEISPLSLPSISALTTADGESSLYTPSTESSNSEGASVSRSTLAGHKRALQPTSTLTNVRVRNSLVMARGTNRVARGARSPVKRPVVSQRRPPRPKQGAPTRTIEQLDSPEPENEPPLAAPPEGEELASKRRRVSLSPPTAVQVTGPARRRVVRPISTFPKTTRVAPTQKSTLHPSARV